MELVAWIESYKLAMDMLQVSDGVCTRYLTMMMEGSARTWLKNLPKNSTNSWSELKEKFIKNFQGTCKRPTTIIDLEHCVQKEGESAHHWACRITEIIHSSDSITTHTTVLVLEKTCKFEPLTHKLGRIKRMVRDMGELMDAVTKYVESDKTKDGESDEDKVDKGKKNGEKGQQNGGNQNQQNNGNGNSNKRRFDQNNSDLVANTNADPQWQKQGGNFRKPGQNFRPNSYEQAHKGSYPKHSKPGHPANHLKAQEGPEGEGVNGHFKNSHRIRSEYTTTAE